MSKMPIGDYLIFRHYSEFDCQESEKCSADLKSNPQILWDIMAVERGLVFLLSLSSVSFMLSDSSVSHLFF